VETVQRDGAAADPADIPAGSQYAALDTDLKALLRRTFTAHAYPPFNDHPTLVSALDSMGAENVNTLVQLRRRLVAHGLFQYVGTFRNLWTTSSLGIDYNGPSMQAAVDVHPQFCKDTAIGESYHHGASCWREIVESGGTPGLHFCAPDSVHIDPHQTSVGRLPGVFVGGSEVVSFGAVCRYSLLSTIGHMLDVEGGRSVNVFHRFAQDRDHLRAQTERARRLSAAHPEAARQLEDLQALEGRRLALEPQLRTWSIAGLEDGDAGPQIRRVTDELQAIEGGLFSATGALDEVEHPTTFTPGTD
jgi:hypothetical protein